MTIPVGTTLTREFTASTQGDLSRAISAAIDENIGYDSNGGLYRGGSGTNQQATIDFKWRGTDQGAQQVLGINVSKAYTNTNIKGTSIESDKVQRVTIEDDTFDPTSVVDSIQFNIAGVSLQQYLSPAPGSLNGAEAVALMIPMIRNSSALTHIVRTVNTVPGNSRQFDIHYTSVGGDATIGSRVNLEGVSGDFVVSDNFTITTTTLTEFSSASREITAVAEIIAHTTPSGTKPVIFGNITSTVTKGVGQSYTWADIANQVIGLIQRGSTGVASHTGVVNDLYEYTVTLDHGYALDSLTIRLTSSDNLETNTFDIVAVLDTDLSTITTEAACTAASGTFDDNATPKCVPTGTVTYIAATPETYGTMLIGLTDPTTSNRYSVSVDIPEDEPVSNIEAIIQDAINNEVIGTDEDGNDIYLSSIVSASVGAIADENEVDGANRDIHTFRVTLDWMAPGDAGTTTVDDSGMTDIPSSTNDSFTTVGTTTGSPVPAGARIPWSSITTSATLQPGGATTHYATLVYTQLT